MDEHIPLAITRGLRRRVVEVTTVQEAGLIANDDTALLDFALQIGAPIVTCDSDFLVEAARRQREGIAFAGVIFIPRQKLKIGSVVDDLELMATAMTEAEFKNQIQHLPL